MSRHRRPQWPCVPAVKLPVHLQLLPLLALLLSFSYGTTASAAPDAAHAAGPVLAVTGGLVRGFELPRGQFMFGSIPFAAAPVGDLRWLPPQPVTAWTDVRDGSQLPPYCVQFAATGITGQEDCLFLNVFTPRVHANGSVSNGTLAPVLVYVHGGSSLIGWSGWPVSDQSDLVAERDAVLVTIQYRLNVFGYLALDELSERQAPVTGHRSSGNYGLQDIVASLHWVQDNIAAFGGDPLRVTLWGQSTGGTNVMALYVSPEAKGLFHAAISLSGSPVLRGTLRQAEEVNREFVENAQCAGRDRNATIACLLQLDIVTASLAVPSRWLASFDFNWPNRHWPDAAVIIVDGRVVPAELNAALRSKKTVNVPFIYGHMANEIDFWPGFDLRSLNSQFDWELWLKSTLPELGWNMTVVRAVIAAYPISDYENNVQLTYETVVNDISYCGGVNNLLNAAVGVSAPFYHFLNRHQPATPVCYFCFTGLEDWNVTHAGHMWDQLMLLQSYPDNYTPSDVDRAGTAALRSFFVDQLASTLAVNSSWIPFNAGQLGLHRAQKGRQAAEYHSAVFRADGGFEMQEDLRWDKCQLLDSLGFAGFGWAN